MVTLLFSSVGLNHVSVKAAQSNFESKIVSWIKEVLLFTDLQFKTPHDSVGASVIFWNFERLMRFLLFILGKMLLLLLLFWDFSLLDVNTGILPTVLFLNPFPLYGLKMESSLSLLKVKDGITGLLGKKLIILLRC